MAAKKEKVKKEKDKKANRKKHLKRLAVVLAIVVLFFVVTAIISVVGNNANIKKAQSFEKVQIENQLVPEKDADGNWTFTTDRDFKVMQLTDIHLGGGWISLKKDAMAINAVAAMVTAEKPDLVVITGDIAFPLPYASGTLNNLAPAKLFAALMENLGVYWTVTFGNHDTESFSYYNREKVSDFYENSGFKYCLYQAGPDNIDGYGNHVINVKNTAGEITQSLFMFDSHSYTDDDPLGIRWNYDNIQPSQIEWYKNTLAKLNEQNNAVLAANGKEPVDTIKSLAFFHIPLTETKTAWYEYADNGYKDTENAKLVYGVAGETGEIVYSPVGEDNLFETMVELGSTKAVFFGHDHLNNFALNYKGIQLTYGYSVDYLAYWQISKKGAQRGCTIIETKPDGSFESRLENFYQDKYVTLYEKEQVTMQEVVYE